MKVFPSKLPATQKKVQEYTESNKVIFGIFGIRLRKMTRLVKKQEKCVRKGKIILCRMEIY